MREKKENTTWKKVRKSPFGNATDLKEHINHVRFEEWDRVLRANERHNALRAVDDGIGRIFSQGFKAYFKDQDDKTEHAVWVHLTKDDEMKIEIDSEFKSKDSNGTLEALVRSLSQSLLSGYMMTVGLKGEEGMNLDGKPTKAKK